MLNRQKPTQEVIKLPGFELHCNTELHVAVLYDIDTSEAAIHRYDALEQWLLKKGYFLQVVLGNGLNTERFEETLAEQEERYAGSETS